VGALPGDRIFRSSRKEEGDGALDSLVPEEGPGLKKEGGKETERAKRVTSCRSDQVKRRGVGTAREREKRVYTVREGRNVNDSLELV